KRKVFGDGEVNIFQKYCPIPLGEVQELTHLLFMKMLPAVIEKDLDYFGEAVNTIQTIGFKKLEIRLQNPFIKELMENLQSAGAAGVGMSSFGPTVYAVTDTNSKEICRSARQLMMDKDGEIILTSAQNSGAQIV
ncbi:MAG TPA: beta-ribofuranosylaminobenzene 5'-phosphate synthase family protein, partial [Methanobacterium sp.]|nr:beta-ribofuranosylaminobenzene 5'-phosphate synthase family protein [Methanobacterium sp.]